MADVGVQYELSTPGGNVFFNDGSDDQFYITEIQGLGGAPVRSPSDPVPYGDGGLSYNWWKDARPVTIDGIFLIQSTRVMDDIVVIRNDMEEELRAALESIAALATSTGTLVWTPQGQSQRTLTVRCDVAVDFVHIENYLVESFHFGLRADNPDWT